MSRIRATIISGILAGLLVAAANTVPAAGASKPADDVSVQTVVCPTFQPYLLTGYGPLKLCINRASSPVGLQGQIGYVSGVTGAFSPATGWLPVLDTNQMNAALVTAEDGFKGAASLGNKVSTAYGPARWGVQYRGPLSATQARFGVYNLITGLFYPSHGWMTIIR